MRLRLFRKEIGGATPRDGRGFRPSPITLSLGMGCLLIAGFIGLLVHAYLEEQKLVNDTSVCLDHEQAFGRALFAYATDHGDRYPPARDWCDHLRPYLKDPQAFVCPAAKNQRCSYAFNARLSGLPLLDHPGRIVVLFESDRGWNAAGGPELLPAEPRHHGNDHWGSATGNSVAVPASQRPARSAPEYWIPGAQAAGGEQGRWRVLLSTDGW